MQRPRCVSASYYCYAAVPALHLSTSLTPPRPPPTQSRSILWPQEGAPEHGTAPALGRATSLLPRPCSFPASPPPISIRRQHSPAFYLREPTQLPRYPSCSRDPKFLPFPSRFPGSPPSSLPPPLPRAPCQALRAKTEVLRGDRARRGGAGDRGVSALSTQRLLRTGTPEPFPSQHSGFCFQK